MRILTRTIMALFLSNLVFGQIELTRSDNVPGQGDSTFRYSADTNVTEMSAGANQTWNYQGQLQVQTNDGLDTTFYLDPAIQPAGSKFPQANMVNQNGQGPRVLKTYVRATTNKAEVLGQVIPAREDSTFYVNYSDNMTQFQYPMNYNDSFYDAYEGRDKITEIGQLDSLIKFISGYQAMKYDGHGTLKNNSKTFNVARLKNNYYRKDSTANYLMGFFGSAQVGINTTTSFIWMDENAQSPLLQISYTKNEIRGPNFDSSIYTKTVNVDPRLTGSGSQDTAQNSSVEARTPVRETITFPNPASSELNVVLTLNETTNLELAILNPKGQVVKQRSFNEVANGQFHQRFNTQQLKAGNYVLKIRTKAGVETARPFVVQ